MSIDISGLHGRPAQNSIDSSRTTAARAPDTPAAAPGRGAAGATADRFSLTDTASQLQQLTDQVKQMPVVDAERVTGVQRSVASGSFQFEPVQAADNLLTQERELASLELQK